jgi:ribonuclease P protein component
LNGAGEQHRTSAPPASTGAGSRRFPRSAKLLKHAAFDQVYQLGRRIFSAHLTVFYLRRAEMPAAGPRIGFTVGRALGGAVQRNRMKRRLREAVRITLARLTAPVDVVINPKRALLQADFVLIVAEIERAFAQIEQKAGAADGDARRGKA